jgi:protein TonB
MLTTHAEMLAAEPLPRPSRPIPPSARADAGLRPTLSGAPRPGSAAAAVSALLHVAVLAAALTVALRVPPEPRPVVAVPLLFEAPAPAAETPAAEPAPDAAPTQPPTAAATPSAPPPPEPAPEAAPPAAAPPPAVAPEAVTPAPPATAPSAVLPLPPPAVAITRPEAVPRHPQEAEHRRAERPAPRLPRRASEPAPDRPAATAAAPALPAPGPAPATPAAAAGPLVPPRAVAGMAGNRAPAYPTQARDRREEGTVIVRVQVTAEGAAAAVSLGRSSGHAALDAAALAAIRSWRFSPATRGGVPVAAEAEVPVAFRLDD